MKQSMKSLEQFIRKDLEAFAESNDPSFHSTIDWGKPIEFLSDRINPAILPDSLKCTDEQLQFLITAYTIAGDTVMFSLSVKKNKEDAGIRVEFSEPQSYRRTVGPDVPEKEETDYDVEDLDDEDLTEEQRESLKEARMFFDRLKDLTEKIKESKKSNPPDSSNCNRCGRKDLPLNMTVNGVTGELNYYCTPCMARIKNPSPEGRTIDDVDYEIKKLEEVLKELEETINSQEMPKVPEDLSMLAFTPVSLYKSMQAAMADLKSEKMEMLSKMDTEARISRELKEALAREDYKKAEKLQKRLRAVKKGKGRIKK